MVKWGIVIAVVAAVVVTAGVFAWRASNDQDTPPPAAPYTPPLSYDLSTVTGMASLGDAGDLARALLARNGFVVLPKYYHQIFSPYIKSDLPPFITMDSLHRTYHVILEEQIKRMETANAAEVAAMSSEMASGILLSRAVIRMTAANAQASGLAANYFTVGALLLDEKVENADPRVAAEVRLIEASADRTQSPLFGYAVDYSQFKPRGFYNDTPLLQRYFRAMTWYGDMAFRQCSEDETRAARYIAQDFQSVRPRWERINNLYAHFIGPSDDLTPAEYADVLAQTGQDDAAFAAGVAKLRDPIYNSMVLSFSQMGEWRKWTKGMRFFGKRYLPDGEIFMALAYAKPGKLLPAGLDVAAANGSPRAQQLLQAGGVLSSADSRQKLATLQKMVTDLKSSKDATHYVAFLRLTEALWMPPPNGAPPFMKTGAYTDKNLTTALAAWASMRHTWQLQGKQSVSYAGGMGPKPKGCVEPNLEFMLRLDSLTAQTIDILKDVENADLKRLKDLRALIADLRQIAQKQLDGQPLNGNEERTLDSYGPRIAGLMYFEGSSWLSDGPLPWMSLIADVHTEHMTAETLEVGTGGAMPIYVIVPVAGKPVLMVGGVYSYYEFGQPIANRLTDADWRRRWDAGRLPPASPWTTSYIPGNDAAPVVDALKRGEIPDDVKYISDSRIDKRLKAELKSGGTFARGEKREEALALLAMRTGHDAMPLLKEEAKKDLQSRSNAVPGAMAMIAEPKDLDEFGMVAMTSTSVEAPNYTRALMARGDADACRKLMDIMESAQSPDARNMALRFVADRAGRAATPRLLKARQKAPQWIREETFSRITWLWSKNPAIYGMYEREPLLPPPTPAEETQYRAQLATLAIDMMNSGNREERQHGIGLAAALGAEDLVSKIEEVAFAANSPESEAARRALVGMDSPATNTALIRMLKGPGPNAQAIVDKLTRRQKCMEAWPALVEALNNASGDSERWRVCDSVAQGLANLDPDGPGFYFFEATRRLGRRESNTSPSDEETRARQDMDRLIRCWKTYAAAKKDKGIAGLDATTNTKYAEDLLAMTEDAQVNQWTRFQSRDATFKWTKQAQLAIDSLPPGDARDKLSQRCEKLRITITKGEVEQIRELFEKYYKHDFGDYPPETPGAWEKALVDNHFTLLDPSRRNGAGQLCDAWGNPYRYLRVSKHSKDPFEVYSFGPNGKDDDGAGDDIVSWR